MARTKVSARGPYTRKCQVYCLVCRKIFETFEQPVSLPENDQVRQKWLYELGLDLNKDIAENEAYLCDCHFEESDIVVVDQFQTLIRYGSTPKRNFVEQQQNEKEEKSTEPEMKKGKVENQNIPHDLIMELLKFHKRNDIEKYQYVSKSWNNMILEHQNILPLRKIFALHLGETLSLVLNPPSQPKSMNPNKPKAAQYIPYLKLCIIEQALYSANYFQETANHLSQINQLIGQRLKVITFWCRPNVHDTPMLFVDMETIFKELLDCHNANFVLDTINFRQAMDDSRMIEATSLPKFVKLEEVNESRSEPYILDMPKLNNFIGKLKNYDRIYALEVERVVPNFGKIFYEHFLKFKNPLPCIKSIKVYNHVQEELITFWKSLPDIKIYERTKGFKKAPWYQYTAKYYELTNEQGWKIVIKEYENGYVKYKIVEL